MKTRSSFAVMATLTATLLGGCATNDSPYYAAPSYPSQSQNMSSMYGTVDSIQVVRGSSVGNSGTTGTGAVIGGLVGGLLGNQVGGGNGRTVATVAGAVGGAVVGNNVEKNRSGNDRDMFQINVRLDNGGYQTVVQDSMNDLYVGNRVRIEGDRVYRY